MGVEALFIHYSESGEVSAATIDGWHKGRGFSPRGSNPLRYIGYHYVIHSDGRVEPGRSDDVQGTHCPGWNRPGVIALCLIGSDREPWYPSESQYQRAAAFIRQYQPGQVWLHREQNPTSCPGRFDKAYLMSLVEGEIEEEEMIRLPDSVGNEFHFVDLWLDKYSYYLHMQLRGKLAASVEIYATLPDNAGYKKVTTTVISPDAVNPNPYKKVDVGGLLKAMGITSCCISVHSSQPLVCALREF
jgi:hypothetical protein